MAAICLYFQVHQPLRLRRYSVFDSAPAYFDEAANTQILRKVAEKCYLPANQILLDLCRRYSKRFRVSFSITGLALEQFSHSCPAVLESFQQLAATGQVEFLTETYYHSLALLYSPAEFRAQVDLHRRLIRRLFAQEPKILRNTELIYSNAVAQEAAGLRCRAVLTEGWDSILGSRSPGHVYAATAAPVQLLLRNYPLSDDIAFRFSRTDWPEWPLTAGTFATRVTQLANGPLCNLFLDYETFGEHQPESSGILAFLADLPGKLLAAGHDFVTPSQALAQFPPAAQLDVPHFLSWADTERDLSAWLGNAMQTHALQELYRLEAPVKQRADPALLTDWRRLTASDHVYYMSTKHHADGAVHSYFTPYESPYDAYINFMNVLDNLRARTQG